MNINTHNTVYIAYAPYGMQTQHTQIVGRNWIDFSNKKRLIT